MRGGGGHLGAGGGGALAFHRGVAENAEDSERSRERKSKKDQADIPSSLSFFVTVHGSNSTGAFSTTVRGELVEPRPWHQSAPLAFAWGQTEREVRPVHAYLSFSLSLSLFFSESSAFSAPPR
jgi:hypothetical protein